MKTWRPGDRVQWAPHSREWMLWGELQSGTVADAPHWPAIDPTLNIASGERIPIDLDTPVTLSNDPQAGTFVSRWISRPYTYTRLYVREQFLEPYQEPTGE